MPFSNKERLYRRREFLGAAVGGLITTAPFLKFFLEGELLVVEAKASEALQKLPQAPQIPKEVIKPLEKIISVLPEIQEIVLVPHQETKEETKVEAPQQEKTEEKASLETLSSPEESPEKTKVLGEAPFFSQFNPEFPRDIRGMGCGPISLAMELAYRGKISQNLSVARGVVRRAQCLGLWRPGGGTNVVKMEKLSETYGVSAEHKSLKDLEELKQLLETTRNPVIVGYHIDGNLEKIGHLILVLNIEQNKVYTHDPATSPPGKGQKRVYDITAFEKAWSSQGRWVVAFGEDIWPVDTEGFPLYLLPSVLKWRKEIKGWSDGYSLDVKTIAVLMQIESAGNSKAVSSSGAEGLFQAMPDKFEETEAGKHFNPDINAKRGLGYFIKCKARAAALGYKGVDNLVQAAQGYNGGINVVGKEVSGQASRFQRFFRAFYTGNHEVIDQWYRLYASHL